MDTTARHKRRAADTKRGRFGVQEGKCGGRHARFEIRNLVMTASSRASTRAAAAAAASTASSGPCRLMQSHRVRPRHACLRMRG